MSADKTFDPASIHPQRRYWQSLEELADTEAFGDFVKREFPAQASEWLDPVGRRGFLKLMGASMALAGTTACTRQPEELIVPYVRTPEDVVPGKPLFFATTMTTGGIGTGILAESHEGRPTKLEGNPDHPSSAGATDLLGQGTVLTLYDPDRSQSITYLGEPRAWGSFAQAMRNQLGELKALNGAGLRFLSATVGSPTLGAQMKEILQALPGAKWHQYEPASRENVYAGAALAFGEPAEVYYKLDQADVIVVLDADLFGAGVAGNVRYARDFANGRRMRKATASMNRLYVAEPAPTAAGSIADHRLPLRASLIEAAARAILAGVQGGAAPSLASDETDKFLAAAVKDLVAARGKGLVIAGDRQPPAVHAVAHAINQALGNIGTTVVLANPIAADPSPQTGSLGSLVADMTAGQVQLLVLLDVNPMFTSPADLDFAAALKKVKTRVHVGLFSDETAEQCHWHVPTTHFLEEWSDARAHDGTASIVQPLILPLYGGKSLHEIVAVFSDKPDRNGIDLVKEFWQAQPEAASQDFAKFWRKALHDGVLAGTSLPAKSVGKAQVPAAQAASLGASGYEIAFAPDPTVYDGRYANNGWLQETPKPLTKITWDNAVLVSPATASKLSVVNGDTVEIAWKGRTLQAPVWVQPGHAAEALTVYYGLGRERAGRVGDGVGYNGYALRTSDAPAFGLNAQVRKTGSAVLIASTQGHHSMEGRAIVRAATFEEFKTNPDFAQHMGEAAPAKTLTLYADHVNKGYAWGIAIDQSVCTGCSACVVACYAENNIPVIGKEEVLRGREMAWIRIDRYFEGNPENPAIYHQPMICQHCENAPCEVVCPVAATTHSSEGLNDMVYNRCVGTRYCSNNCPYKVRRFNFLLYSDWDTPSYKLQRNPNVTVRSRGVMEKCTYCVQRINRARQDSKVEGRTIQDGEVKTACQQACPTDAIVFGNINDPASRVSQLKAESHNYGVLAELNTRPRTTYLAAVKNPNPALETELPGMEKEAPHALPKVPGKDMSETNSMTHAPR
jgi:molybdopterin-containing oxidoreductase family iron-sulfur binding subunit